MSPPVDTAGDVGYYSPVVRPPPGAWTGEVMMRVKTRISIIGVLVSIIAALISAMLASGSEVRLAFVLMVFCSGFAGGASLVSLICNFKYRDREEKD